MMMMKTTLPPPTILIPTDTMKAKAAVMATTTATPVASSIFATVTTLLVFFSKYPEDVRRYFHHFVDDCKVQNLVFKELVYANVWVYFPMTYFITFLVNDGSSTRFRCKGKELVVEETESESENDDIMIGIEPEKDHSSEDDIVIKIESKSSVYNWGEAIRQFAYECIAKTSVEHTTINGRSISILSLQENTPVQKWLHVKIKSASSSIRLELLASNLYVKDYIGPNNEKWKRFKEEG
ncbi:hypothetical protein Tsubulata_042567 [Turnera subulata]|uniref:Uncharacterized protein n=1 Tax=Turnera subulata TaxID=218843 RepID=A0A9Q0G4S1_9ROSI|nr:hypothetical protein Tsubulata_042567 [Turnera subulata]